MKSIYLAPLVAAALVSVTVAAAAADVLPDANSGATLPAARLGAARDLGHAADTRVDFSVILPYRHPGDLPLLLKLQQNPKSKYYKRFLKASEFRNYFSPTPADYAATARRLRAAGFTVETFANRTVLHAYGRSGTAERFFATTIDRVRQPNGKSAYANVTGATIPATLAGTRVVGLDSIAAARTALGQHPAGIRPKAVGASALFGPDAGFGPRAITKAFDFPLEHGYTGKNTNVADIIDGQVDDVNVATFLTYFGTKRGGPRTSTIRVDAGCFDEVAGQCADDEAANIDAEWIVGTAPGASLFTYQLPNLAGYSLVDGFNAIASDDFMNIVHIPIAGCETNLANLELALAPILDQAAVQGITFEAITFGSALACSTPGLPTGYANLDSVTGVGASNAIIDASGRLVGEAPSIQSSGGVSGIVPLPFWQAGTPGVSAQGRNVPDLVIPSVVNGSGPSFYFAGLWQGGYEFVNDAPMTGYLATVQEMYGYPQILPQPVGQALGNFAFPLYLVLKTYGYASGSTPLFSDVSVGCIGVPFNPNYPPLPYTPICAKRGYDAATGIGSVGGFALAKAVGALDYGTVLPPTP